MTGTFRIRLAAGLFVAGGSLAALVFVLATTVGGDFAGVLVRLGGATTISGRSASLALLLSIFLNNLSVLLLAALAPAAFTFLVAWTGWIFGRDGRSKNAREEDNRPRHETFQRLSAMFLLYFPPALVVIANGAMLGLFLAAAGLYGGVEGVAAFAAGVAPHGVVEIPATLAAAALGLGVAGKLMPLLASGDLRGALEEAKGLTLSGRTQGSLLILTALLALAAIIEVRPVP